MEESGGEIALGMMIGVEMGETPEIDRPRV
jgi:hypothetical protein